MNLKNLSIVSIRLMAIYVFVVTLPSVVMQIPVYYQNLSRVEFGEWMITGFLYLGASALPALVVWMLARPLSKLVTGGVGEDSALNSQLPLSSLETLCLRLIGLYLLASSLPVLVASCFANVTQYIYSEGFECIIAVSFIFFAQKIVGFLGRIDSPTEN